MNTEEKKLIKGLLERAKKDGFNNLGDWDNWKRENKKKEKGSIGWLLERAKKDGFNNLGDWDNWKRENKKKEKGTLGYYQELAKRYGKEWNSEFIKWVIQQEIFKNPTEINNEILNKFLERDGSNIIEYGNKCAEKLY